MYIIRGQLARNPEISLIKVKNSVILSRNIFIINRQVIVVIIYNKACKRREKIKYIFCYFPD